LFVLMGPAVAAVLAAEFREDGLSSLEFVLFWQPCHLRF